MTGTHQRFDIAVIGAGSASESLVRALDGRGGTIAVFEPRLVGGECPFLACIPSKSMLHDARIGRTWDQAVQRRDDIVSHLDDGEHARGLEETGATLIRSPARLAGPGRVEAGGVTYDVDHVVIATGAAPTHPDIDGLDPSHHRVWTSSDALTATTRPNSIVVIGGGVIGSELAVAFAGFGTSVITLDETDRPLPDMHPAVSGIVTRTLESAGVQVVNDVQIERVDLTDDHVTVLRRDGTSHRADQLLVATGRAPNLGDVGLDTLGLSADDLVVDDSGAVVGAERLWIAGDAAGREQYTHVANHHGAVLADRIAGSATRSYADAVVPACIFIDPPVLVIGPSWAELGGDDDVVWAEVEFDQPRGATDEFEPGFLALAARRSTGCLVAANGVGARFDELAHAIVIAIDGEVSVARLRRTIQPFPTAGGVLTEAFGRLGDALDA